MLRGVNHHSVDDTDFCHSPDPLYRNIFVHSQHTRRRRHTSTQTTAGGRWPEEATPSHDFTNVAQAHRGCCHPYQIMAASTGGHTLVHGLALLSVSFVPGFTAAVALGETTRVENSETNTNTKPLGCMLSCSL